MSRFLTGLLASLVLLTGNAPAVAQSISGFGGGSSLATPVSTLNGGSGAALTPVIGDILAADSTTSFARIAAPAVGQVLTSNGVGVAPSWSASPTLTTLTTAGFVYIRGGADNRLLFGSSVDTSLSKVSAGVIGIGTGTQGSIAGGLQAATVALGGATIGSNALAVTGTISAPSLAVQHVFGTSSSALVLNLVDYELVARSASVGAAHFGIYGTYMNSTLALSWSSSSTNAKSGIDTYLTRGGAATLQHGYNDAAAPVAQTIKFQDVVAGTTNTAGVNATIQAPAGTGTGAGGSLIFQVAPAGSTGTAKNAWATALTIDSSRNATFGGSVITGDFFRLPLNSKIKDSADGVILLSNNAVGDFNRLQFGGTTSSFPAIKRSTTSLQARLADDSAFTAIQGKLTTDTAYTAGDPTTTGYLVVYDSTGTAYRVPALLN